MANPEIILMSKNIADHYADMKWRLATILLDDLLERLGA